MPSVDDIVTTRYKSVFQQYYPKLLVYAISIVGQDDAEDVVADVFTELWRHRGDTDMGDKIQAFLYRAVYTRSLNVLKHRHVTENYLSLVEAINVQRDNYYSSCQPQREMENHDLHKMLSDAIGELPDKCREVFRLSYIDGLKNSEIAEQLGISVKTVEAHMYKALKSLRERLEKLKSRVV